MFLTKQANYFSTVPPLKSEESSRRKNKKAFLSLDITERALKDFWNIMWVSQTSSLQIFRCLGEIAAVFLLTTIGPFGRHLSYFPYHYTEAFLSLLQKIVISKYSDYPTTTCSALLSVEPTYHHVKWKSGQHSLLKIAGLGFTACAGKKRGAVGSGDTHRLLEDILLYREVTSVLYLLCCAAFLSFDGGHNNISKSYI